ncbi:MAG: Spx/MgsR family RNA polymerase-binding regulatory protein [Ferruginibacter sp.]
MIKVYGIPNCDTIKKTQQWLTNNQVLFEFHDYKKEGITVAKLKKWIKIVGWEILFNKKSSTWKKLKAEIGKDVTTAAEAIKLMQAHNSIIKRPVVEYNATIIVGFEASNLKETLLR